MELYNSKYVYFDWNDKLEGKKGFFSDDINTLKQAVKDNRTGLFGEIIKNIESNSQYPFEIIDNLGWHSHFRFFYYDPYYEFRKACLEGKRLQFKNREGNWEDVVGEPCFTSDEYRIKSETWYIVLDDHGLSRINSKKGDDVIPFAGTEEECIEWMKKYKKFEDIMLAWKQGKTIQYKNFGEWTDWVINDIPRSGAFNSYKEWRIKDEYKEYVPFDTVQELIDAWDEKYPQNKNRPEGTMPLIWIKNKQKNRVYLITDFLFEKWCNCDVGTEDEDLRLTELFNDFTFLDGSIIGKRS